MPFHQVRFQEADIDLMRSMDLDTYIRMRYFISDLVALVEAGNVKASDNQALSAYSRLFVQPDFDFEFPQMP